MSGILAAWVAEIVLITYRSAKRSASQGPKPIIGVALPSEYAASFVIYGGLSFIPESGARIATAVGWGLVLATALNLWDPSTLGNKGGPAIKGGPSTQPPTAAPTLSPMLAKPTS